mmetsp:Transcript_44355/g.105694  ORF Transcript_44355/g.105694 Transcript_44355/m.105694 type:complete len:324 (+) Transcript_44355:306-1277(+)
MSFVCNGACANSDAWSGTCASGAEKSRSSADWYALPSRLERCFQRDAIGPYPVPQSSRWPSASTWSQIEPMPVQLERIVGRTHAATSFAPYPSRSRWLGDKDPGGVGAADTCARSSFGSSALQSLAHRCTGAQPPEGSTGVAGFPTAGSVWCILRNTTLTHSISRRSLATASSLASSFFISFPREIPRAFAADRAAAGIGIGRATDELEMLTVGRFTAAASLCASLCERMICCMSRDAASVAAVKKRHAPCCSWFFSPVSVRASASGASRLRHLNNLPASSEVATPYHGMLRVSQQSSRRSLSSLVEASRSLGLNTSTPPGHC